MQRTTRSSLLTVKGAPHNRQLGGAPGADGGPAAKAAPTRAAPLTRIILMPTIAAMAWTAMSGSQIPTPLSSGRTLRLDLQKIPAIRSAVSPLLIKMNGANVAHKNHHRGQLIWFKRDHSRAALRVAWSS